jgi:hypothetical protein
MSMPTTVKAKDRVITSSHCMIHPTNSKGSYSGTNGTGLPTLLYSLQYLGGRSLGVCFAQVKAGVICHWESKGVQAPATRRICSVRTGWADAGRHWSQGVDGQGAGLAISACDQQTEQAQFSACGKRL